MAAEIVGDLAVRIVPDGSGFPSALNAMLGNVQKQVQQNVNLNTSAAQQSVQQLGNSINTHVNGAMANAIMQAGTFTAAFYTAKGMINKVRSELAGLYDPLVKATAGFKAILGEQKGSKLLEDIRQFAKDSPFVTQELVSYSQQLLGVGQSADSIIPLLQNTGDLIASLGGSQSNISRVLFTLTQIRSMGRLAGQDAMQLQSAQIPITKLLAETMNVPLAQVKKLQEQGKISADKVFEALNQAGAKVRGSMDAVTNTIEGARSVLQDTITIMFQNQTSLRAIYDDVVKSIKAVANVLASDEVTGAVTDFFDAVYDAYEPLKTFITEFSAMSGRLAMMGLRTMTDILKVLANVLNSIPEITLKMLAQSMATLATIRAPLYLMDYVKQLKTISELVKTGAVSRAVNNMAGGITKTGAAATDAAGKVGTLYTSVQKMAEAWQKYNDSYWKSMPLESVPEGVRKRWGAAKKAQDLAMQEAEAMAVARAMGYVGPQGPQPQAPTFLQRNLGKFTTAGALAASVGSQYIPQDTAIGAAASGAMSMGSMGLMAALGLGATGPVGAGVAIGAALLGGITSYMNKSKEMEQAMIAKWQKLGADSAKAWIESQTSVLMGEGQEALDAYATKIAELQKELDTGPKSNAAYEAAQRRIDEINAKIDEGGNVSVTERIEKEDAMRLVDEIGGSAKEQKVRIQKEIDDLSEARNKLVSDYSIAVQEILKQDPELEAFFERFANPLNKILADMPLRAKPFDYAKSFGLDPSKTGELQRAMMALGLGLDDLKTKGAVVLAPIINAFVNMPEAVQAATAAVTGFNLAIDKASGDKPLEQFQKQASSMQGMVSAAKSLRAAMVEITPENLASVMDQITSASQQEYNLAFARADAMLAGQALSGPEREARARSEATKYQNLALAKSFIEMRKQIGGSDKDFEALLKQMGYYELYSNTMQQVTHVSAEALRNYSTNIDRVYTSYGDIPKVEPGARASLAKIAQIYQVTATDLATILAIQGQINPNMVITVTAETDQALQALGRVAIAARAAGVTNAIEFAKNYKVQYAAAGAIPQLALDVQSVLGYMPNQKVTGGGGGGGISPLQQVTENFKGLFKQVADTIKQSAETWKTSVRESAQYQQAVSVSTATKNARQQAEDLKAMNEGIARLKARGLTEEAITSLGITGVKDLKQVRKLLGASDAELVALSTAIKERDKAATDLADARKAEENKKMMTDAIVAAAKILKVKVTDEQVQQIINNNIDVTVDASDQALADLAKKIADLIKGGAITR